MENWYFPIEEWLKVAGLDHEMNGFSRIIWLFIIWAIAFVVTRLFHHIVIPAVHKITAKTKATWDDYLFNQRTMEAFCRLIPPLVIYMLLPMVFSDLPYLLDICMRVCLIYFMVVAMRLVNIFLKSMYEYSNKQGSLRSHPLKGIYQMLNVLAMCIGAILIISILINRSAATILAGLGASAAVLMLVFKDSILGLVAGIQLSANDMLRPGDWITMPKYGADGYVLEVSLTTVKVQNFDKTIITVPPYALVSDSFQNWRGMRESGGRRIKRSIYIDVQTIRFCSDNEISAFKNKGWIADSENEETSAYVNLQVFRNYLLEYIRKHPRINHDMLQMVRQLQPTPEGVPLEIYCFSSNPDWVPYEDLQSELMDHILAIVQQFGLRIYQKPTGSDLHHLG